MFLLLVVIVNLKNLMLKGRQFDGDGNLVEWWNEETISKFEQKAKCIIEQYGNYTDEQTMLSVSRNNAMRCGDSSNFVVIAEWYQ